jgi:para-nitrobenzyl esterase
MRQYLSGSSFVAVVAVALMASGCALFPPTGPAPLRYRDAVFTDVVKTADITYAHAPDQSGTDVTMKLDVYAPKGDKHKHRPAIVWVHGGSFSSGDKTSPELIDESYTFAKEGYVNFSIDYRLYPPGCSAAGGTAGCVKAIVDASHDAQAAVRWVRANAATYGVDPSRIAIGGSSAGAIVAMDVAFDSEAPDTTGSNQGYSSAVRAAMSISGARLVGNVDKKDAPTLLFHGTADPLVPYNWGLATYNDAKKAGLESYLITWDGEGHVPYLQHRSDILTLETNFLYSELDLAHAPSN